VQFYTLLSTVKKKKLQQLSTDEWTSLVFQLSYTEYCFGSYTVDRRGQATALTSVEMLWSSCDNLVNGHRGSGCTVKRSTHPFCLFRIISKASTQSQLFSSIPCSYITRYSHSTSTVLRKSFPVSRYAYEHATRKGLYAAKSITVQKWSSEFCCRGGYWRWASSHDK